MLGAGRGAQGLRNRAALAAVPREMTPVPRGGRALVLVTALAAGGPKPLRLLYRLLDLAAAFLGAGLGLRYGLRVRLSGAAATRGAFLAAVKALAAREGVAAVDVVVNLHGHPGELVFADGPVAPAALAPALRAEGRGKLRLAYSSACHGESHGADLLAGGFTAAVGARRVNATGATEFGPFLLFWALGVPAAHAVRAADPPALRRPTDAIARRLLRALGERGEVDSRKVLAGDRNVRIARR